mmetsp:Transcript_2511/g.3414  ORF Transcript_2511/g.3414 Transcript_2511/m.3414 type:complete len:91 (+) Transcript_2511:286-558(+)
MRTAPPSPLPPFIFVVPGTGAAGAAARAARVARDFWAAIRVAVPTCRADMGGAGAGALHCPPSVLRYTLLYDMSLCLLRERTSLERFPSI